MVSLLILFYYFDCMYGAKLTLFEAIYHLKCDVGSNCKKQWDIVIDIIYCALLFLTLINTLICTFGIYKVNKSINNLIKYDSNLKTNLKV